MMKQKHFEILKQGVEKWNTWREQNSEIDLNLNGVDLSETNLVGVDLYEANLSEANFCGANLNYANIEFADLSGANLNGASLSGAYLEMTDFSGANLSGANLTMSHLSGALFSDANLSKAILTGADLSGTRFYDANLTLADLNDACITMADLSGANLSGANLSEANLHCANLSKANLKEANLTNANLVETNLEKANLTNCKIYGISAWNLKLQGAIQSGLIITSEEEPTITVDDLEVAQFIYLILYNEKIRTIINTIGKKAVLILGRFTPERKVVIEAIKEKLKQLDFVPIVFDFEQPIARDFTETIITLAGMSCFVIADITNPNSSPLELQITIPNYMIPFVPIIQEGEKPFSMFKDLNIKYEWVLDTLIYDSVPNLLKSFEEAIIAPAIEMQNLLMIKKAEELMMRHVGDYM